MNNNESQIKIDVNPDTPIIDAVLHALDNQIKELARTSPKTRVSIITFSDNINAISLNGKVFSCDSIDNQDLLIEKRKNIHI